MQSPAFAYPVTVFNVCTLFQLFASLHHLTLLAADYSYVHWLLLSCCCKVLSVTTRQFYWLRHCLPQIVGTCCKALTALMSTCVLQAIALSRKQMADRGIRQAVDSVRSQAPSPPPHRVASQARPSSSNHPSGSSHQLPGPSNRGPGTMPSTSGRPVQASAAPCSRPLPPSNLRQGSLGYAAQRPASDAQRYSAQAMPAWMQKAKQAGVQAKLSASHEHSPPFAQFVLVAARSRHAPFARLRGFASSGSALPSCQKLVAVKTGKTPPSYSGNCGQKQCSYSCPGKCSSKQISSSNNSSGPNAQKNAQWT